jgi:hypothetical protein
MGALLEVRQPRIAVYRRLGPSGPVDPTHRAAQGVQLYIAPRFTIHGAGGVTLRVVIHDSRGTEAGNRGPWPLAAGGGPINPIAAPMLPPGKYRIRLEGEMLPGEGPRRPLDEVAEWELTITDTIEH